MDTMKPTPILKKYFGLKEGQDNMGFIAELRELRGTDISKPSDAYIELTKLAAAELGVTPEFS